MIYLLATFHNNKSLILISRYTILLQHGDFKWTIKRRYKHILYLHQQLTLYRASLNIPFPTKTHKSRRASFKNTVNTEEIAEKIALDAVASSSKKRDVRPRKRKGALPRCTYCCTGLVCAKWQDRWLFVKDTFFGYIRPTDGAIKAVMLFDQGFEVSSGMYSTGLNHGLQILNQSRQMVIKCWTKRKSKEWMAYLKTVANQSAREFTYPNVHHSFAPPRAATPVGVLVDGAAYLSAVADAMELATEEIFIADWWLSPEIYMKRPALNGNYWRLDCILKRKAVIRHPDHARVGVLFWAHHEKIVCVDQTVAFLGGIDLCYGRWDDHKHRLTDLGNIAQPVSSIRTKKKTSSSPGGGLCLPTSNGIEAAIELAKSSKNIVMGITEPIQEITIDIKENDEKGEGDSENKEEKLPVLEPGDQLLITSAKQISETQLDSPDQKKNVLNKITDRGKDIFSVIYPPFEEERNEQRFDDSERKKAEKYALSNDQVLLTDALGIKHKSVSQPTPLAQVVEGRVITESTKEALEGIEDIWSYPCRGQQVTYCLLTTFLRRLLPQPARLVARGMRSAENHNSSIPIARYVTARAPHRTAPPPFARSRRDVTPPAPRHPRPQRPSGVRRAESTRDKTLARSKMADGSPEYRADRTQMNDLTFSAPDSSHGDLKKYSGQTLDGGKVKLSFYKEPESSVSCEKSALSGVAADDTAGLVATDSRKSAGSSDGDDRKKRCFDRYDSSESSDSGTRLDERGMRAERGNCDAEDPSVRPCASLTQCHRSTAIHVLQRKKHSRSVNCAMHLLPPPPRRLQPPLAPTPPRSALHPLPYAPVLFCIPFEAALDWASEECAQSVVIAIRRTRLSGRARHLRNASDRQPFTSYNQSLVHIAREEQGAGNADEFCKETAIATTAVRSGRI
ncbi:Phospholipase D1 [Papilio machaon]|uniref:phospholipase D n=1 Tax=Papilio machaon TaxID=76193 RepID=A0A194QY95_PAPMA|nr:Phospholipase D1 [Papilio machaon]